MRSIRPRFPAPRLALLLSLLTVPACAKPDVRPGQPIRVSAVRVTAANAVKPVPGDDARTEEVVSAAHSAKVETWSESVARAWGRICRTLAGQEVEVVCSGR